MVFISGIGLLLIGINHYINFWAQNHITLDLLVSIIFIASQTLVMFFFVGTGVNVREYLESHKEIISPYNDGYYSLYGYGNY